MFNTPTLYGSSSPEVLILFQAPTEENLALKEPFSGASKHHILKNLTTAGIPPGKVLYAACHDSPLPVETSDWISSNKSPPKSWNFPEVVRMGEFWVPLSVSDGKEKILQLISSLPSLKLIIALDTLPLLYLVDKSPALTFRGSVWNYSGIPLLSTLHPATIFKVFSYKIPVILDWKKAGTLYRNGLVSREQNLISRPTFPQAVSVLTALRNAALASPGKLPLAIDIETRANHIACVGVAWSATDAICIPLMQSGAETSFWGEEEEITLTILLAEILQNCLALGQNFLYDSQYFHRRWGVLPKVVFDTMIAHHATFSALRKGLDFLASIHSTNYVYWKDESKDWRADLGEEQLWLYNCKDACYTWEITEPILTTAKNAGCIPHVTFQHSMFFPILTMTLRGFRTDKSRTEQFLSDLALAERSRQAELDFLLSGFPLNIASPTQMVDFFYSHLGFPPVLDKVTGRPTSNAAALDKIASKNPWIAPLIQIILELRSIQVFRGTFLEARLDEDLRMRTGFAISGTETYRLSSAQNAFHSGMNFQNIPKEAKKKLTTATKWIALPNVRETFIPDPGQVICDQDLDRADLQVVVWEADDSGLKSALAEGIDMHLLNASDIFGLKLPVSSLVETHPDYAEIKKKHNRPRQLAKIGVHATNYGVGDRQLSEALGISILEAASFRQKWFAAHPGIRRWHNRIAAMAEGGYIENRFQARYYLTGRPNLPALLAWIPQSTVGLVINRILRNYFHNVPEISVLCQVHDSLVFQLPASIQSSILPKLQENSKIIIPYPDPLVIPTGFKFSPISWGDC